MKQITLFFTLCLFATTAAPVEIPKTLSYQGVLTDAQGNPVPDGTVDLTCRLYQDASGGNPLWAETQQVAVVGGVFSTILGSSAVLNLPFDKPYWLGLTVNGDSELEPRTLLTASAYSLFAESIADNSVSGKKIKDDAVTGKKIDDGNVVRSINSITDDVTLVEGNNIDITKNGSQLTISATTGNGGLTEVETNSTLNGKGTSDSPLEIAVPLIITGESSIGVVRGKHTNGNNGNFGGATYGVYGQHNNNNNRGWLGQEDGGVFGFSGNGNYGYIGTSTEAVYGISENGFREGMLATQDYAVFGSANEDTFGFIGSNGSAVYGYKGGNYGFLASSTKGLEGYHASGNYGIIGQSTRAAFFKGNVDVSGSLSKSGGSFQIDHPLDPANKYLAHSFVESPDMMNVYNGNIILDGNGEAVVELPDYFGALNRDFRYQLTCIGGFAPVYVAQEIDTGQFTIAGGQPGLKVSWQVTGVRQDKWANENRIVVEEVKPANERGYYLHPKLFGLTEKRSVEWGRDPEGMREMAELSKGIEYTSQRKK